MKKHGDSSAATQGFKSGWKVITFTRSANDKHAGQNYKVWVNPAGKRYRTFKSATAAGFTAATPPKKDVPSSAAAAEGAPPEAAEGDAAAADPSLAHGGEDLGHVILDIDEDDLLNALADELGNGPVPDAGPRPSGGDAMPESFRRRRARLRNRRGTRPTRRTRTNESRQIRQYRGAVSSLKKQLVEMNLFNAKLLYANKLMQNKNLTIRQQKAIVEALDNAKTLREAKLLYKSLSESLTRRARGKNLNEGNLRTLGSSSRSTRSAQPNKSGVEADRWAVLAGLNNGND